jgi:outer membrane protein OmpA-like peptidoglycan-associated protein
VAKNEITFMETPMRFISSVFVLALTINTSGALAQSSDAIDAMSGTRKSVDVAVLCEYYSEFKKYNVVLCAYGDQFKESAEKVLISKNLACAYPTIRQDLRICPEKDVEAMKLPDVPYLLAAPQWPKQMKPVLTAVNGKALNEVLKMHEALFNNEYEIGKYCVSQDGELEKTDRILCAPFVEELNLVDTVKLPTRDMNIYVDFASGSTSLDSGSEWTLQNAILTEVERYRSTIEALNIPFNMKKVKMTRIKIIGRADARGDYQVNRDYSQARAYATEYALRNALSKSGFTIPDKIIVDWVGSDESSCYEETQNPVCRTEDAYGNFVSGRSGWRQYAGDGDRCYNDEYGRNGWHYPKKQVCSDSDRSSRVEIHVEYELVDLKDAEIKKLRARLEELKQLKQNQKPITIHQR